jgi:hypothetical protein
MLLFPFGVYFNACAGILSVSVLSTCCSRSCCYCFISKTMFCTPSFSVTDWFLSLPNLVVPKRYLKNFSGAASSLCSSHFFRTQASLPNFKAALVVILWILNFVSLVICFPKCLHITPFILLYVGILCSESLL